MSLDLKEHSLPPELAATALRELNETPTMRREGLRELRRRVAETEDADDTLVADSAFLLRFLRCKKFDVNRSFSVYQGYCRFRRDNADMLEDLDPHSVRHVWDGGVIGALSARDKKGRSVMVGFPGRWEPCEHGLEDVLRALVLQLEHLIVSEETQVNGIVLIADFKNFSLYQARCLRPWYFQMMTSLVQVRILCSVCIPRISMRGAPPLRHRYLVSVSATRGDATVHNNTMPSVTTTHKPL